MHTSEYRVLAVCLLALTTIGLCGCPLGGGNQETPPPGGWSTNRGATTRAYTGSLLRLNFSTWVPHLVAGFATSACFSHAVPSTSCHAHVISLSHACAKRESRPFALSA